MKQHRNTVKKFIISAAVLLVLILAAAGIALAARESTGSAFVSADADASGFSAAGGASLSEDAGSTDPGELPSERISTSPLSGAKGDVSGLPAVTEPADEYDSDEADGTAIAAEGTANSVAASDSGGSGNPGTSSNSLSDSGAVSGDPVTSSGVYDFPPSYDSYSLSEIQAMLPAPSYKWTASPSGTAPTGRALDRNSLEIALADMDPVTKDDVIRYAREHYGFEDDYTKLIIGSTQREGYYQDPYLSYAWACVIINNRMCGFNRLFMQSVPAICESIAVWDPIRSGDTNFYSWKNIQEGYNTASMRTLKCVMLALTNRDAKICEVDGMNPDPSLRLCIYSSAIYNCDVFYQR